MAECPRLGKKRARACALGSNSKGPKGSSPPCQPPSAVYVALNIICAPLLPFAMSPLLNSREAPPQKVESGDKAAGQLEGCLRTGAMCSTPNPSESQSMCDTALLAFVSLPGRPYFSETRGYVAAATSRYRSSCLRNTHSEDTHNPPGTLSCKRGTCVQLAPCLPSSPAGACLLGKPRRRLQPAHRPQISPSPLCVDFGNCFAGCPYLCRW